MDPEIRKGTFLLIFSWKSVIRGWSGEVRQITKRWGAWISCDGNVSPCSGPGNFWEFRLSLKERCDGAGGTFGLVLVTFFFFRDGVLAVLIFTSGLVLFTYNFSEIRLDWRNLKVIFIYIFFVHCRDFLGVGVCFGRGRWGWCRSFCITFKKSSKELFEVWKGQT